jgi:hypothetical protein
LLLLAEGADAAAPILAATTAAALSLASVITAVMEPAARAETEIEGGPADDETAA